MTTLHYPARPVGAEFEATRSNWQEHARCRNLPPNLFFPQPTAAAQAEQAKAECRRCPVMEQCARWAMDNNIADGVWGGLTEEERRGVRRRGDRRHQYKAARDAERNGQILAVERGAELLALITAGTTDEAAAEWFDVSPAAIRRATRLLVPERATPRTDTTALERLLRHADELRHMNSSGLTPQKIATRLNTMRHIVEAGLAVLAQRDRFLAGHAGTGMEAAA